MNTTIQSNYLKLFLIVVCILTVSTAEAQYKKKKKSEAQIQAEQAIDAQRLKVQEERALVEAKQREIDEKQQIFDRKRAKYQAEEERIKHKDAVVKNMQSCTSNILADILPSFGQALIGEQGSVQGGEKKITEYEYAKKMMPALQPAYMLAHKEHLSTYFDNSDRAAFRAEAERTFPLYYEGGKDERSGEEVVGIFETHFNPAIFTTADEVSVQLSEEYIKQLEDLQYVRSDVMQLAKSLPAGFYTGWDKFIIECGRIITSTMQDGRRRERIPEVAAQKKFAQELREDFLHLEDLKEQKKQLEQTWLASRGQVIIMEEDYLRLYEVRYE